MTLSTITWVIGLSSLVLLILGYTYSVLFLFKYIYVKKILVPIVALVAFCCGSFYLGPSVSFLSLIFTGKNISGELYFMLSYFLLPVGTMGIVLMALNVFLPKMQKPAILFFGSLTLVFWIAMFGFTNTQFEIDPEAPSELLDIGHANVSLAIAALSLLSILFIDSFGFFLLARKLKNRDYPISDIRKAYMISCGWFLFFISGVVDALFTPSSIILILIIRLIMIIAYNFIYIGFWSKPTRIEQ